MLYKIILLPHKNDTSVNKEKLFNMNDLNIKNSKITKTKNRELK